jgi:hypothetical protein
MGGNFLNITITGMSLDDHYVPVPAGLSDLLNSPNLWVKEPRETKFIQDYDRRVEKIGGNLVTFLTLKKSS